MSAITREIEFLRLSHHLATEFTKLKSEVFSSSIFALLKEILPGDYIDKVNDTVTDVTASAEQKMKKIREFLEKKKIFALMGVSNLKGSEEINESGDDDLAKAIWDPLETRYHCLGPEDQRTSSLCVCLSLM